MIGSDAIPMAAYSNPVLPLIQPLCDAHLAGVAAYLSATPAVWPRGTGQNVPRTQPSLAVLRPATGTPHEEDQSNCRSRGQRSCL